MFRCYRVLSLFICFIGLAGCASNITRQTPDVQTRRVSSAEVVWVNPGAIPMAVSVSTYGYSPPPVSGAYVVSAGKEVEELLTEIRGQMTAQIETALKDGGATRGDDAQIRIRVTGTHHTITGPGAVLVVSVHFKESPPGTKPWSVEIKGGTPIGSDSKSVAGKFARTAVAELAAAGIIKVGAQ
jgi:hypothetical protein